ncbi:5-formyltetrahydrofolate cyclo-ligase [Campylobacter sp. MIT 12-8780]|uniref:5-formyltetrahydrofolate cyclo-ligase n=1 Tax=unclassified Campylobacter TaxID=2593542 RepID=UPI00115DD862|nr:MULTISPECIES: 5-formyltetrahydrofolate cyclo-ligase [unclassified Campylobacter]NDJ27900.1 5-formyltetrahydrofolate cyclo-ligase [Campylobacter sp. MIT 19-121]TQR40643.1 5-formyltetrahydrofolate cyclo-ligase [Campylobacter sp. MIT 12-8780]
MKEEFRKLQKSKLIQLQKYFFRHDFAVFKECLQLIKNTKAKNVLIYLPLTYELDLYKFRHEFSKNCQLFVPFMQDESLKVIKLRLPFYKKRFGVKEPKNSLMSVRIDLAIVPVLGVDKSFKRIGHGKGFYDRFFASLKYKPLIVFVQATQGFSQIKLSQEHDIQGDFYLNPFKKFYKKELKNADNFNCIYRRYHRRRDWVYSCQKNKRCKA